MKPFLSFLLALLSIATQAQVETTIAVPTTAGGSPTFNSLLYLPPGYPAAGVKYPLLVFLHGSGESCPPLSNIYNSATAGGPPYEIEHGTWPSDGGFTNPKDGQKYKYIVLSPQSNCNGWSSAGDQADFIVQYMVSHYNIDTNRIYMTGLSSGGGGCIEYSAHIVNNGNENLTTATRRWKLAAQVPMSFATNSPPSSWANLIVKDSTRTWGLGDQNNDVYGENTWNMCKSNGFINTVRAGFSWFTGNPGSSGANNFTTGHGPWRKFYIPTYRENFTWQGVTSNMSIYEWMLINTQSTVVTPTANAGSPQTITLPTSTVTLTGSASSAGVGHSLVSYRWIQQAGPITASITTSTSANTGVTGLTTAGAYTFQLTVTDDAAQTSSASVTITVNSSITVVANAGSPQTVTLPTNSVSLSGAGSTGPITTYAWTEVSGPNTATIVTPSTVNTNVTGLIVGSYVFRLSVNGAASTANVTITVNPAVTFRPCGSGQRYVISPDPSDSGYFVGASQSNVLYNPGDTIVLNGAISGNNYYSYVEIDGFHGNPSCPLVIINGSGQPRIRKQIKLDGCTYVKITGTGDVSQTYGIRVEYDKQLRCQGYHAVQVSGKSKNIEIDHIYMHNVDIGIVAEGVESCDNTLNYPNWVMDTVIIHDTKMVGCWNEGMYIGNTSPDNASFDLRPVFCTVGGLDCTPPGSGCDTFYYAPPKNGYTKIYNNIVDSTGRGGIQVSNAAYGVSEVYNNTISHSGLNGDDAQGAAIDPGLYTRINVHDNIISNTYTWGIAFLGSCSTGVPQIIQNNRIDSSGYLRTYDLSTTSRTCINPATEPTFTDSLPWPYPIFLDTKTRLYTDQTPHAGTAVRGQDSTQFWIKSNVLGLAKSTTRTDGGNKSKIQIQNDVPGIQSTGNVICNNTNFNGSPATVFADSSNGNINYSVSCATPPTVTTGPDQIITLPTSLVTLVATVSAAAGASITSTIWSQLNGATAAIITTPSTLSTTVTGLALGTYVFRFSATDSNGNTSTGQTQVTVKAGIIKFLLRRVRYTHKFR